MKGEEAVGGVGGEIFVGEKGKRVDDDGRGGVQLRLLVQVTVVREKKGVKEECLFFLFK